MKTIREFVQSTMTESQKIQAISAYEILKITGKIRPSSILLDFIYAFKQQHKDIDGAFKDNAEFIDRFALELYRYLAMRYIATQHNKESTNDD